VLTASGAMTDCYGETPTALVQRRVAAVLRGDLGPSQHLLVRPQQFVPGPNPLATNSATGAGFRLRFVPLTPRGRAAQSRAVLRSKEGRLPKLGPALSALRANFRPWSSRSG
jgi:hypothetical protein